MAVWPLLQARRIPPGLQVAAGVTVFFAPLLISPHHPTLRGFASLMAADLMFKLIDYARHQRSGVPLPRGFGAYAVFLIPFPALLVCFRKRTRRPGGIVLRPAALRSVISGAVVFASGLALVFAVNRLPAVRASFLLDHVLKVAIFVPAIAALSKMLRGLEQLAGYETTPLIQGAFRSTTPGEFWSRYNTRVHAWFYEHVFLPSGGHRAPVRGLLLTFLASAVLHEAAFALATSRLDGYQFNFFMLQAPAVLASRPLHRFAVTHGVGGTLLARTLTVTWLGATSIFFFHGVSRVFPFLYASKPWLP